MSRRGGRKGVKKERIKVHVKSLMFLKEDREKVSYSEEEMNG